MRHLTFTATWINVLVVPGNTVRAEKGHTSPATSNKPISRSVVVTRSTTCVLRCRDLITSRVGVIVETWHCWTHLFTFSTPTNLNLLVIASHTPANRYAMYQTWTMTSKPAASCTAPSSLTGYLEDGQLEPLLFYFICKIMYVAWNLIHTIFIDKFGLTLC